MNQALKMVSEKENSQVDLLDMIVRRSRTGSLQDITLSFTKKIQYKGETITPTSKVTMSTTFISEHEYRQLIDVCQKPHMNNYLSLQFSKALEEQEVHKFYRCGGKVEGILLYEACNIFEQMNPAENGPGSVMFRTHNERYFIIKWY